MGRNSLSSRSRGGSPCRRHSWLAPGQGAAPTSECRLDRSVLAGRRGRAAEHGGDAGMTVTRCRAMGTSSGRSARGGRRWRWPKRSEERRSARSGRGDCEDPVLGGERHDKPALSARNSVVVKDGAMAVLPEYRMRRGGSRSIARLHARRRPRRSWPEVATMRARSSAVRSGLSGTTVAPSLRSPRRSHERPAIRDGEREPVSRRDARSASERATPPARRSTSQVSAAVPDDAIRVAAALSPDERCEALRHCQPALFIEWATRRRWRWGQAEWVL